jgi:hypothetical protein
VPFVLDFQSVCNLGYLPRRLSATFYAKWVLGTDRANAPLQIVCERDAAAGAVLVHNSVANTEISGQGSPSHLNSRSGTTVLGELALSDGSRTGLK